MSNHDNCIEVIGQFTSRGGGRQQRVTGRHHTSAAAGGGMYGLPAADEGGDQNPSATKNALPGYVDLVLKQ